MTGEEGTVPYGKSSASHTTRRHKLRHRHHRVRLSLSALSGIVGCLCGALVLQQFHWLLKIVPENDGNNRFLLAPLDAPKTRSSTSERAGFKISPSYPAIVDKIEGNIERESDEFHGKAILFFRFPNHSGQGTGNVMSGALAAQLLAEEFNRTLCHAGAESTNVHTSFRKAFEWRDHRHQEFCDRILSRVGEKAKDLVANASNTIVQRNYDDTSEQSECAMSELLSNHVDYPIVYYEGNTYPRWPSRIVSSQRDYFHERFKPTQALREVLPWKESAPPPIIVHLRDGDDKRDHRGGLDDQTLSLLAENRFLEDSDSQRPVFLVTNNVEWYSRFSQWSHPDWSLVHHSALKRISWGGTSTSSNKDGHRRIKNSDGELQMWSDWYTLLNAREIYHTFSDFSRSASRWNEKIKSWTILGSTDKIPDKEETTAGPHLLLRNDIEDGVSKLVDRTTKELWFCGNPSPEERKHLQEKRERQLLNLVRARKQGA